MARILILIGGGERSLEPFLKAGRELGQEVKGASFSRLEFSTAGDLGLRLDGEDLADFDLIYLRVVGQRYEDAALVVQYAREKGIPLVDKVFEKEGLIKLPLAKSLEVRLLTKAGVPVPPTYFGSLRQTKEKGPELFGFPFVIKGTTGKQGHAVWSPRDEEELAELAGQLRKKERKGGRFIAQQFIKASQRDRLLVIGDRVVGAITRPTRWRKRFLGKDAPSGKREAIFPVPRKEEKLALAACQVLGIDIGGVDLIREDTTDNLYVLEVNSAPRWASLKKETGVKVEEEIVKFLIKRARKSA